MEQSQLPTIPYGDGTDPHPLERKTMPRDGSVGQVDYERVTALLAEGKSRTEAFNQVADERGSKAGTVAAGFYRVARAQGQSKSEPRKPRAATTTSLATSNGSAELGNQLHDLIESVAERVANKVVDERLKKLIS